MTLLRTGEGKQENRGHYHLPHDLNGCTRDALCAIRPLPGPGGTSPTQPLDVSVGAVVPRGSVDRDLLVSETDSAQAKRIFANHEWCVSTCLGSVVEPNRVLAATTASFFAVDKTRLVAATALASARRREVACDHLATSAKLA